jgi:hypothetical protein
MKTSCRSAGRFVLLVVALLLLPLAVQSRSASALDLPPPPKAPPPKVPPPPKLPPPPKAPPPPQVPPPKAPPVPKPPPAPKPPDVGKKAEGAVKKVASKLPNPGLNGGIVNLVDEPFICSKYDQPLDLTLVKVTITGKIRDPKIDSAVNLGLRGKCSGRIGRIEVLTNADDAMKILSGARDLVVESALLTCTEKDKGVHQDGIQVQGGHNVALKNVIVECFGGKGVAMYLNTTHGAGAIENVVCDGCVFRNRFLPDADLLHVVTIGTSTASGARNSIVCDPKPRTPAILVRDSAVRPVNVNNQVRSC